MITPQNAFAVSDDAIRKEMQANRQSYLKVIRSEDGEVLHSHHTYNMAEAGLWKQQHANKKDWLTGTTRQVLIATLDAGIREMV